MNIICCLTEFFLKHRGSGGEGKGERGSEKPKFATIEMNVKIAFLVTGGRTGLLVAT